MKKQIEEKYAAFWIVQEGRREQSISMLKYDRYGSPYFKESGWYDQRVIYREDDMKFKTKEGKWEKLRIQQ